MDLDFTEVQDELRKVVREFVKRNYPSSKVREMEEDERGFDTNLWKQIAQMGWIGWTIPQQYGGLGGELMDLVVILEEMGKACFISPFLSTVLCSFPIIDAGSEEQKNRYLPHIANGDIILSLAWAEPEIDFGLSGIKTKTVQTRDGFVLNGTKFFVPFARVADGFLVLAGNGSDQSSEDDISIYVVNASSHGVEVSPLQTISQEKQNELVFKDTPVISGDLIGHREGNRSAVGNLREKAVVLKCAEMLGGADWVVENCVNYARERVQYGHAIGSYGIIQNYLAEMWAEINMARRFLYYVVWKLEHGMPCTREAAMIKTLCNDGYKRWTRTGVQVFGAIGTSREHDMGLYYRRARESSHLFGSSHTGKNAIAVGMGLGQ